ncbi:MAG: MFS transporter [Blastocatellia bacterium]
MAAATSSKKIETENPEATVARAGAVMAILFMVFFLGVSDNQMISPLLPLIAREFKLQPGDAGKLIGPAYALAAAMIALVVGPASDKFGRRRFLLYASILFGASLLSVLVIRDIRALAGVRFITGLAAGTFSTCSIAYVGDYFPYQRRGVAMSVVNSGYFAALVVGVPVGAVLGQRLGWRSGFVAFGVLALITFFLVLVVLPEDRHNAAHQSSGDGSPRFANIKTAFSGVERKAAIAAAFFVSAGFVGFIYYLGSWLEHLFGLSPGQVGLVFIAVGVASLAGSLIAGPVSDRIGKRGLSVVATLLLALALAALPRFAWGAFLFAAFLVASLSFAFRQGPLQALATELVPRRARGALVASRTTTSQIGIAVSTGVCGYLYDRFGYSAVGLFCAVTTLAAAACIYMMREPSERPADEW